MLCVHASPHSDQHACNIGVFCTYNAMHEGKSEQVLQKTRDTCAPPLNVGNLNHMQELDHTGMHIR